MSMCVEYESSTNFVRGMQMVFGFLSPLFVGSTV